MGEKRGAKRCGRRYISLGIGVTPSFPLLVHDYFLRYSVTLTLSPTLVLASTSRSVAFENNVSCRQHLSQPLICNLLINMHGGHGPLYARGARLLGFEPHQLHSQHHPSRLPASNFKTSSGFVPTHRRHMIVLQQPEVSDKVTLTVPRGVKLKIVTVPFGKGVHFPIGVKRPRTVLP